MIGRVATAMVIAAMAGCGGESKPRAAATPTPSAAAGGTITFCAGRFFPEGEHSAIRHFNREHRGDGLRAQLRQPPADTQQAHDFLGRNLGSGCDVADLDGRMLGEFAAAGVLLDLSDYVRPRGEEFIGHTLEMARYDERYWGVPRTADAGLLYYRTSVGAAPKTWQEIYAEARRRDGLIYPGAPGESRTISFLEHAYAAGGAVLSRDGTRSALDSPQNLRALKLMRQGIASGAAQPDVLALDAEQARRTFADGRVTFMRNWPYAYGLLDVKGASRVAGRFDVAPLPRVGVLTGPVLVVAARTDDREAALAFVDFLTSLKQVERAMVEFGVPPALTAAYEAPGIGREIPHHAKLRAALDVARPAPVTPAWVLMSEAISTNVGAALEGRVSPRAALRAADREVRKALAAAP